MRRIGLTLTVLALLLVPATAQARDRDRDKLPDTWEKKFNISTKKKSGRADPDRDGLSNLGEYRARTNPRRADTDRDRIRDDDEDPDRDRVDNGNEEDEGTRPRDPDSDDDGIRDGREDRDRDGLSNAAEDTTGNDPTDTDTDDDGTRDGAEQAGVVTSFEGGKLTIDLANGSSVSGLVTGDTEIECETEDQEEADNDDGPSARASSDDESGSDEESDETPDEGEADEDDGERCSTADLVPGARVHEAEGRLTADGLVFEEIELVK